MVEFILLFLFFWWLFSRNEKRREKRRRLFKPSLDQELRQLIQAEDNSTGIALSVKQYLLDVLDDDNNDREKYSDERLSQGQLILDKAGASALYFMADIATQLSIVASAQINGIPNNVEADLRGSATPANIINKVIKI
jgi:DNA-binding transcriptional MerR regulator